MAPMVPGTEPSTLDSAPRRYLQRDTSSLPGVPAFLGYNEGDPIRPAHHHETHALDVTRVLGWRFAIASEGVTPVFVTLAPSPTKPSFVGQIQKISEMK